MTDKFRDQAVQNTLYTYDQSDAVSAMLSRTDHNSRVNQEIAQFALSTGAMTANWKGKYQNMWADQRSQLERYYLVLGGYSRLQAIEMKAASTIHENDVLKIQEGQKKSGLLGLFGKG